MLTSIVYPVIAASWIVGIWSLFMTTQSFKDIEASREQSAPGVLDILRIAGGEVRRIEP
jgi:hypothetical protein